MITRLWRMVLAAVLLFGTAAAPAAEVSAQDAIAIRAVITAQLDAFARDDAPRAFSFATEGIRAQFGAPEAFIEMVRTDYPVVYRPKEVYFGNTLVIDDEVVQPVRMIDAHGHSWVAFYPMERGADGKWRINGCQLQRLMGTAV